MNNMEEFLKELFELCSKHDIEVYANEYMELYAKHFFDKDCVADEINMYFNLKEITYKDKDGNFVEIKL